MTLPQPRYVENARLSDPQAHTKGVACLAFSPTGTFLASGGLEGKLCIWSARDNKLQHVVQMSNIVLSVVWHDSAGDELVVCGLEDGSLVSVYLTKNSVDVKASWAHEYPVERLAIHGQRLASGAHPEVRVWTLQGNGVLNEERLLEGPPQTSINRSLELLVTGVHWTQLDSANALLVSYMHHGIIVVECTYWTRVRTIPPYAGCIGYSSLSPDGRLLAVSNMVRGFDVYSIRAQEFPRIGAPLDHEMGELFPTPILFVHGGRALLTGSTVGEVRLWEQGSGSFQTLAVGRKKRVLSVAAHHHEAGDVANRHIIATGVANPKGSSPIIIWTTEDSAPRMPGVSFTTNFRWLVLIGRATQVLIVIMAFAVLLRDRTTFPALF